MELKTRFKVVIPVVNRDLAARLMESIRQNTLPPGRVFVIDNTNGEGGEPVEPLRFETPFPVDVAAPAKRLGVNASWNLGIRQCADCDAVSILNDDVVLERRFFERNARLFREYKDCGVACPATVHDLAELSDNKDGTVLRMRKREGWAFSVRRSLLDQIPPVPRELHTFCGDDWFWLWTHKLGFRWYKDTANIVYHETGVAVRALGVRPELRKERAVFKRIMKAMI